MSGHEILLVEDHERTRVFLHEVLTQSGYAVTLARDGGEALQLISTQHVDLVLSDYQMNPMDGLTLLRKVRRNLEVPFILYSAGANSEAVFRAGRDGAFRFLEFPFRIEEQLLPAIVQSLRQEPMAPQKARVGADRLTGGSVQMHRARIFARRVAPSKATVLITGETGTGKELMARAIHEESERKPFLALTVTELPDGVLESELFGHERGAFTGAVASHPGLFRECDGGTLFLDEIGDAPPRVQASLLRVLETGEVRPVGGRSVQKVDTRIVAATHRDLEQKVERNEFRQDLYYRLHQTHFQLPPLREHAQDIEPIAYELLDELTREANLPAPRVHSEFFSTLRSYHWPGNVRELRSVLQNVILWWDGRVRLGRSHLVDVLAERLGAVEVEDQLLRERMLDAYRRGDWNQEAARRELGMSRGEWRNRWRRLGLDPIRRRKLRPTPAS